MDVCIVFYVLFSICFVFYIVFSHSTIHYSTLCSTVGFSTGETEDRKRGRKNEDALWQQKGHGDARGRGHDDEMGDAWTENDFGGNRFDMTSIMASIIGSTE